MAGAKAVDAVYDVDPPRTEKMLRELLYSAYFVADHTTHFYALAGPDFVIGPDAPIVERNILGIIHKVGLEIGGKVILARKFGHNVIEMIGGKIIHPCTSIPGGLTKGITEEQRQEIEKMGHWAVELGHFSLKLFEDIVLKNSTYLDLILGDIYTHRTYYIGLVDENNKVNFYDGKVSVVDPEGNRLGKYAPKEYTDWIAEHVEPWTYLKFPYLKKVGWKGFVDGKESGVYIATPLSRLNAADGMATPRAPEEYEKFYKTLGGKPVHQRLATHWARLIELLYAAERWVELATDPEITSDNFRTIPTEKPTEGVGIVEAPRGTLTHHYWTDERGIATRVNLIVGTTNNYASLQMSTNKAARALIKGGKVNEGRLTDKGNPFKKLCIQIEKASLGGLSLMEKLIDADQTIIVDAIDTHQFPKGTVRIFKLKDLPDLNSGHTASIHDTSLANAIEVGRLICWNLINIFQAFVVYLPAKQSVLMLSNCAI